MCEMNADGETNRYVGYRSVHENNWTAHGGSQDLAKGEKGGRG